MQAHLKLGLAILAVAFAASAHAAGPDVAKTPTPPAPVPIPYPNVMGSPEQEKQQAAEPALKNRSSFKHSTGDEAEVRTYTFKQAWPKKTESPKPGVVTVQPLPAIRNAPPPPPTPAWPSKIEGPTMVDISKARRPAPQQPQQLRTPVLPR